MRNITLNMVTAFVLSILLGYWFSFIFTLNWKNGLESSKNSLIFEIPHRSKPINQINRTTVSAQGYLAPVGENLPPCDPFWDKNRCVLNTPLQTILKTTAQQTQYIYVLQKLDELQLPRKLALIPIIESQYNSFVKSPRGAAGMWQLMPGTAKDYGLLEHQRFELEASTFAALKLLKELHDQFGSWELAIAAYNAGSKRVHQALLRNPQAKKVQDLRLPRATKKYVDSFNQMQALIN